MYFFNKNKTWCIIEKKIYISAWLSLSALLQNNCIFLFVVPQLLFEQHPNNFGYHSRCFLCLLLPHVQSLYSIRSQNKITFFYLWIIQPFTRFTISVIFTVWTKNLKGQRKTSSPCHLWNTSLQF